MNLLEKKKILKNIGIIIEAIITKQQIITGWDVSEGKGKNCFLFSNLN